MLPRKTWEAASTSFYEPGAKYGDKYYPDNIRTSSSRDLYWCTPYVEPVFIHLNITFKSPVDVTGFRVKPIDPKKNPTKTDYSHFLFENWQLEVL